MKVKGAIQSNLRYANGNLTFKTNDIFSHIVNIGGIDYTANKEKASGANSFIFKLYCSQEEDADSLNPVKVLKLPKRPARFYNGKRCSEGSQPKIIQRFTREQNALTECKSKLLGNVIEIDCVGYIQCEGEDGKEYFPFYMMDYADADLRKFMESHMDLDKYDKLQLCYDLTKGIDELYSLGYYHRDIKPENILFFSRTNWKIGDLGLVAKRDDDFDAEQESENVIGPKGWLSPEAMNRCLRASSPYKRFDCKIDHQSDIFQLGKVFWYIFQGNVPIGCIKRSDFLERDEDIYSLIKQMLNHSKSRRPQNTGIVLKELERLLNKEAGVRK